MTNRSEAARTAYPLTTGLQAWSVALLTLLRESRAQLSEREFAELIAIVIIAVAREASTVTPGTDEWLEKAA
jgi:hypothetical protein